MFRETKTMHRLLLLGVILDKDTYTPKTRRWIFRLLCIPIRVAIATIATIVYEKVDDERYHRLLAAYMFITAFTFFCNYIRAVSVSDPVGAFGGVVWWQSLRLVHALLYAAVGVLVLTHAMPCAPALLYIDVLIGIAAASILQE